MLDITANMKYSAAGCDEVGSCLINKFSSSIIKQVTYIFTKSLETGIIPDDPKSAKVLPSFKPGD